MANSRLYKIAHTGHDGDYTRPLHCSLMTLLLNEK